MSYCNSQFLLHWVQSHWPSLPHQHYGYCVMLSQFAQNFITLPYVILHTLASKYIHLGQFLTVQQRTISYCVEINSYLLSVSLLCIWNYGRWTRRSEEYHQRWKFQLDIDTYQLISVAWFLAITVNCVASCILPGEDKLRGLDTIKWVVIISLAHSLQHTLLLMFTLLSCCCYMFARAWECFMLTLG